MGKALGGASGGYTATSTEVGAWLRQRSRPYLFSNSLAPMVAAGSIAGSATLKMMGRDKDALFVGQWAPTFLILGLYNKIVKVIGSD